jgi:periplasmic copper chaperone A
MKTSILSACLLALATTALATTALGTTPAAQEFKAGSIEIDNPWSRATPKGATVAAGFFVIKNTGTDPDRLVGGTSSAAGKVEVHEMSMDKGVMKMRPVSGGLEIKPGETVELKPGSFHIMMMNLKQQIEQGKPFKASLNFEKAGPVEVEFKVVAPGAMPSAGMPGMPAGHMHNMHPH